MRPAISFSLSQMLAMQACNRGARLLLSRFAAHVKIFHLQENLKNSIEFTAIDAGCGNGWATRILARHDLCQSALGVDAAELMIKRAEMLDECEMLHFVHIVHQSCSAFLSILRFCYFKIMPRMATIARAACTSESNFHAIFSQCHLYACKSSHGHSQIHNSLVRV